MYDKALASETLEQILIAARRIEKSFRVIKSSSDFLASDDALDKFDAICMRLAAIGEGLKNFDKITDGSVLSQYPQVDWTGAKKTRDFISHHYVDLDAEVVFKICTDHLPTLITTVETIISDIEEEA